MPISYIQVCQKFIKKFFQVFENANIFVYSQYKTKLKLKNYVKQDKKYQRHYSVILKWFYHN